MQSEPTSGGGVDLHRAMEFERGAIIFHLLMRWQQRPDAVATIESYEDATIVYPGEPNEIIEDVQCKKAEDGTQTTELAGMGDWFAAKLTRGMLKDWLEEKRRGTSSIDRLGAATNRYFSLLAFAEPAKGVAKYVPPGVVTPGWTRHVATTEYFPIDYARADDPDPSSGLGNSSIRSKIRIVPFGPPQLQIHTAILLHRKYGVAAARATDAYFAIEHLLYGHMRRNPEKRTFRLPDIETAIRAFCSSLGKWIDVRSVIDAEQAPDAVTSALPVVRWSDFKSNRYIRTDMLGVGAAALAEHGFVVISGNNGSGKTALCRYLAYTHLASNAAAQCFYLQTVPGDELRDELDFFKSNLARPCLFIIDDEQFSEQAIKTIAQAYLDLRPTNALAAKLVIATTNTSYSQARREGRTHALDDAYHVKFDFLTSQAMNRYLASYQQYRRFDRDISRTGIAEIAGGSQGRVNMGVALILAHSVDHSAFAATQSLSIESESVRVAVIRWLASNLRLSPEEVRDSVVPVFTVSSYGLPVERQFSKSVEGLKTAGFLEEVSDGTTTLYSLRPEYSSLAWLISRQSLRDHNRVFQRYAETHSAQLAKLAHSLSHEDTGKGSLIFLVENHLDLFAAIPDGGKLDLSAMAMMLRSVRSVRRRAASDLVRLWFRRGPQRGARMIALRAAFDAAMALDVRPLSGFLDALYRADEVFSREVVGGVIDDPGDLHRFLVALRACPSDMEAIVRLLRNAKTCDLRFGVTVATQFANSPQYDEKWAEIVGAGSPVLIVRVLRDLSGLNRRLFMVAREKYLTEETVSGWVGKVRQLRPFVEFLSQLQKVKPRSASRALTQLASERGGLGSLINVTRNISESTSAIGTISRVDRRIATRLARESFEKLSTQIAAESQFNNVALGIGRLWRRTATDFARRLATRIEAARVAESMQAEQKRFEMIGRALIQLAEVSLDVASAIASGLNYRQLYARVNELPLFNYARLTQGLCISLPPEAQPELLSYIRDTPQLAAAFHRSLFNENSLHQVSDAVSTVAAAGLSTAEVLRLFGSGDPEFRDFIRNTLGGARGLRYSDGEIANFLFALYLLDPAYAADALATYAESHAIRVEADPEPKAQPGENPTQGLRKRLGTRFGTAGDAPRKSRIDLAGSGSLFEMSAAIDDEVARAILRVRLPETFGAMDVKNLGRHSTFLLGMHNVSRVACLRFMKEVYTPERCETLFDTAQNPRELIQFLHTVQIISAAECRRIGSVVVAHDRDNLRDYLEAEVDLGDLSRWVNTLVAIGHGGFQDLGELAIDCSNYDTGLWGLVEAAQAMIGAGLPETAAGLATRISDNVRHVRGVRRLSHCIQLWLKVQYISRSLGQPKIGSHLAEELLPHALDLIPHENDSICSAFAIRLWLDSGEVSETQRGRLEDFRALLIRRCGIVEPPSIRALLTAVILQGPEDQIAALLRRAQLDGQPAWVLGLLQLTLDVYFEGRHDVRPSGAEPMDLEHNNLKYGLAGYAQKSQRGQATDLETTELGLRHADESSAAIRHLLSPEFSSASLLSNPYYLWVYLRRTLLKLSYLEWNHEVQAASSAAIFGLGVGSDPESMLRAAE